MSDKKEKLVKFKAKVAVFKEHFYPDLAPKCISDQGLLYLRYGIWKLKDFYGKNYLVEGQVKGHESNRCETFSECCIRLYNNIIRGNVEYTNRPIVSSVASLVYMCCIYYGVNITQKDIAEIYGIGDVSIRKRYREFIPYIKKNHGI